MKDFIIPGIIIFFLLYLPGCSEQQIDINAEGEKLMEISREWSRTASTDSIEKIVSYWSEDAVIFQAGQQPVIGKKALKEMVEKSFKTPGFKISWEPVSAFVSKSGDLAYLIERNQVTINDSLGNPVTIYGQGVTIWRKDPGGSWKNVIESIQPLPSDSI